MANLPDFSTDEVADHTMALLLSAARQLKRYEGAMRRGQQPRELEHMHRLFSRTLGLVGFGRIGLAVARRAASFGMKILAVDPRLSARDAAGHGVEKVDLETALMRSDYQCLLCPLTPRTRHMLTIRELRAMKPGAVLVNTARGGLVNEDDLALALREGIVRHAALDVFSGIDVFDPDGFPVDHPFFGLDNVTLTPHVAACSEEAVAEAGVRGAQAVADVMAGLLPAHLVNPGVVPWWRS